MPLPALPTSPDLHPIFNLHRIFCFAFCGCHVTLTCFLSFAPFYRAGFSHVTASRSMTSLRSFESSSCSPQSKRMTQSQTPGLDTLAEGSQYALEQLQLAREAGASANAPTDPGSSLTDSKPSRHTQHLLYSDQHNPSSSLKDLHPRDSLAEARSAIRKNSAATPVRRRISRACDQCNQLRTKCDGQNPCAHCVGMIFPVRISPMVAYKLIPLRIRSQLRVRPRAQEARQSVEKGSSRCGQ